VGRAASGSRKTGRAAPVAKTEETNPRNNAQAARSGTKGMWTSAGLAAPGEFVARELAESRIGRIIALFHAAWSPREAF